jgi:hypothetical protein
MQIPFEQTCALVAAALDGPARAAIVDELANAKNLGAALTRLREAMRANEFRAGSHKIFLDRAISSYDGRTIAEGFNVLHDWDGVSQQVNPDIIPVDVLNFLIEQRGGDDAGRVELAILVDYYFFHVLQLLSMRIWDQGNASDNLSRVDTLLTMLQGERGSGQQFAADAATLMLIATSHYELHEWGYDLLLERARTLNDAHRLAIGVSHAQSMGCHLRFGFEAQCGRDTLALRDDNVADYPWLCFALAETVTEYGRLATAGIESRERSVIEEAMLNGLTPDARAFLGTPPSSLSKSERERARFVEGFTRHQPALIEAFRKYRPTDTTYSPLSFFFNFSHNIVKGTVIDALLWGEPWNVTLNDLLTGVPRAGVEDEDKRLLVLTLMGYARANPDRIRGQLMPVIVYDPQAGRRAFTVALEKLGAS